MSLLARLRAALRAALRGRPADAPPARAELYVGDALVARLRLRGYAYPWADYALEPGPGFAAHRAYFADPENWPDADPAFDALLAATRAQGVRLIAGGPDLARAEGFERPIHLYDDYAEIRFGDAPAA